MEKYIGLFSKITTVTGDLTQQPDLDIIVNAANDALRGGGGVCGAIFKAAGWKAMQASCNEYPEVAEYEDDEDDEDSRLIRCRTGFSVDTPAHNLPNKRVIHSVGPVYSPDPDLAEFMIDDLHSAYTTALRLADGLEMTTIGFPAISCGIFHYPLEQAAKIAVNAICDYLTGPNKHLNEVRFVFIPFADGPVIQKVFEQALNNI